MSKLQKNQYHEGVQFTFNHFSQGGQFLNKQQFTNLLGNLKPQQLGFTMTTQITDYLFKRFDRDNDGKVAFADLYPVLEKAYYAG